MELIERAPRFTFKTKTLAEEFLKRMRVAAYKYDVVTVNDILKDRGEPTISNGYNYGYCRAEIKKLKAKSVERHWHVTFPIPSLMVRDENGYWTTENAKADKGG